MNVFKDSWPIYLNLFKAKQFEIKIQRRFEFIKFNKFDRVFLGLFILKGRKVTRRKHDEKKFSPEKSRDYRDVSPRTIYFLNYI